MKLFWTKYTLNFKELAGTSRGVLRVKDSYFLKIEQAGKTGWGECGILKGLSADDRPDYEARLQWLANNILLPPAELFGALEEFPSIQFGLEMALRDLQVEKHVYFPSLWTEGKAGQAINGLIWMGNESQMREQISLRLKAGFKVLKMKVGAIDFAQELGLLKSIRSEFDAASLTIRVDANGAFSAEEALKKLEELATLNIHSIEQPIKAGQWSDMAQLCEQSPIPIALDEELIGLFTLAQKRAMLDAIKPSYLILKPSFIGGWRGADEWVALAEDYDCQWWVTSALESNLGLSAIAQWNYLKQPQFASGLGTGSLYTNNLSSPLEVNHGELFYNPEVPWDLSDLDK